MKKMSLIMGTLLLLAACTDRSDKDQAVNYFSRATDLHAEFTDSPHVLDSALVLLDSAILHDPDWTLPYQRKHTLLLRKGDYQQALNNLLIAERLEPNNADIKSLVGFTHLLNNQEEPGNQKLEEAERLWDARIDTLQGGDPFVLLGAEFNRLSVQKMLGKDAEAAASFRYLQNNPLYHGEEYEEILHTIDSMYINQTRDEIFHYLITEMEKSQLR